jgi:hypothetical protein
MQLKGEMGEGDDNGGRKEGRKDNYRKRHKE